MLFEYLELMRVCRFVYMCRVSALVCDVIDMSGSLYSVQDKPNRTHSHVVVVTNGILNSLALAIVR